VRRLRLMSTLSWARWTGRMPTGYSRRPYSETSCAQ
jgi:hypothetical protein